MAKERSRKIRVFHIITHFDLGGAERIAANIAKSGNEDMEYHVVEVLRGNSNFTSCFISELEDAGVCCHRSLMPEFHFHFIAERLVAILFPIRFLLLWLRYHPDVIHAHTEIPDMCLYAFFRVFSWLQRRCRIVRTIHNTCLWTGLKHFGRKVERFYQRSNANVAISRAVAESYGGEYGEQVPVIYNGVEKVIQKPFPGLDNQKTNVLFAGRLEKQKGVSHLIYLIKEMLNASQYHFYVVGGGLLQKVVDKELGSLPNVSIYKPMFGLSAYVGSFDYMLMPSEFEGLGLMSVEASLAGVPVVCNDCAGLNETVSPDWQLMVHDNSHAEYTHIFRDVLPQTNRDELSQRARCFVEERFSMGKMQKEYEKIYLDYVHDNR